MITPDDVLEALRVHTGEPDAGAPGGDRSEVEFAELGYDSLALMEVASVLGKQLGVALPDELVVAARTPAELATLVNTCVGAPVAAGVQQ